MNLLIFGITIFPCLFVLMWIWRRKMSIPVIKLLVLGLTAPVCAIIIEKFILEFITYFPIKMVVPVTAFFAVAFVEEGLKFAAMSLGINKKNHSFTGIDGAFCGAVVAMGFVLIENIAYLMESASPLKTTIIRAVSAVPLHTATGILIGISWAISSTGNRRNIKIGSVCLPAAIAIHGLYDWPLMDKAIPDFLIWPILLIAWIIVAILLINSAKKV